MVVPPGTEVTLGSVTSTGLASWATDGSWLFRPVRSKSSGTTARTYTPPSAVKGMLAKSEVYTDVGAPVLVGSDQ